MPGQWQGVGSDSDQDSSKRVGSKSMAALRARRVRPSGVREEESGALERNMNIVRNETKWKWR